MKNVIKHQYIKAHCVNIKKEDNTLKYIYNNPKQKITEMVSVCGRPVVFTSKGSTSEINKTPATKYNSSTFSSNTPSLNSSKLLTYILL